MLRSSIRSLLREAEGDGEDGLVSELRAALRRDDDYRSAGKPVCDWSDPEAREALVHELASDVMRCLRCWRAASLQRASKRRASCARRWAGQDLEQTQGGRFQIARRVAKDRIISTVDTDARHGHKTSARGFDGYKGHIAVDPGSELITRTVVTAGNVADGRVAGELIADLLEAEHGDGDAEEESRPRVYGDAAYGTGAFQELLEEHGIESLCRTQEPPSPRHGGFSKARFDIDLEPGDRDLPCGRDGAAPPARRRLRHRPLREGVRHLPAAGAVHDVGERADDHPERPRWGHCRRRGSASGHRRGRRTTARRGRASNARSPT